MRLFGRPLANRAQDSDHLHPHGVVGESRPLFDIFQCRHKEGVSLHQVNFFRLCVRGLVHSLYFLIFAVGAYAQAPTVINGSDAVSASRSVINANFSNLYLGKMHLSGAWSSGATYNSQDMVTYANGTYVSLQPGNIGQNPSTATAYWFQVAGIPGVTWLGTSINATGSLTVGGMIVLGAIPTDIAGVNLANIQASGTRLFLTKEVSTNISSQSVLAQFPLYFRNTSSTTNPFTNRAFDGKWATDVADATSFTSVSNAQVAVNGVIQHFGSGNVAKSSEYIGSVALGTAGSTGTITDSAVYRAWLPFVNTGQTITTHSGFRVNGVQGGGGSVTSHFGLRVDPLDGVSSDGCASLTGRWGACLNDPAIFNSTLQIGALSAGGIVKASAGAGLLGIAAQGTDYSGPTNGTNGQALTSNGAGGFGTPVTLSGSSTNGTNGQGLTSNGAGGFGTPVTFSTSATTDATNAANISSGTLPVARLTTAVRAGGFQVVFGGADAVSGGVLYVNVPYACTITDWVLEADAGTPTIKLWRVADGGTAVPTSGSTLSTSGFSLATGTRLHSTTLSDLSSTAIAAWDTIGVNLFAASTATKVMFSLGCQK